jgi:uncharacterized protein YvpB
MRRLVGAVVAVVMVLGGTVVGPAVARADDVGDGYAFVDVPAYAQQRNLSCEYAAMTIATAHWGGWVSEYDFDQMVGWSANPHWGFRGDINGWWGNTVDYGVYPEALAGPLANLGYYGDIFYGQGDSWGLRQRLSEGAPVVVWLGMWGDQSFYDYTDDGTAFKLTTGYHVEVAYGYDADGVYLSDPAHGEYTFYSWGDFMWRWNVLDGMAMAVWPG